MNVKNHKLYKYKLYSHIMTDSFYKNISVLSKKIFKNPEVLKDRYIPDKFLFRDNERKRIMDEIMMYFYDNRLEPNDIYIYGPPSTGKTHMIKSIINEVNEFAKKYEWNIQMIYTSFKNRTYTQGLGYLAGINVKPKSGYSSDDLVRRIVDNKLRKNDLTGIVFDEIDKMRFTSTYKIDTEIDNLVGTFTKFYEMFDNVKIFSIFISNKDINKYLTHPTKSTFSPLHINFRGYTPSEIYKILEDRCKMAFNDGIIDDNALSALIQKLKTIHDLRLGLKTLFMSGKLLPILGKDKIDEEVIDKAFEEVQKNMVSDRISKLDYTNLLVVYYTALLQKENHNYPQMTEIYNIYKKNIIGKPLSFNYISNYVVPRLEGEGLLMSEVKGLGRGRGKARFLYVDEGWIDDIILFCEGKMKEGIS